MVDVTAYVNKRRASVIGLVVALIISVVVSPIAFGSVTAFWWLGLTVISLVLAGVSYRWWGYSGLVTVVVLWGLVSIAFFSPVLQPIFYFVLYKAPSIPYWTLVSAGIFVLGAALYSRGYSRLSKYTGYFGIIFFVAVALILGPLIGSVYMKTDLSNSVMEDSEFVENLSLTDHNNVRIMPASVGREVSENRMQYPRHSMAEEDIVFINGTPHWSFALQPDGLFNSFQHQQGGAIYADMTTRHANVFSVEKEFKYGQGQYVTDNYLWQLRHDQYFVDHKTPFVVPYEGDMYIAVPKISYEHKWRWTPIPQPYSVPTFDGVHLIDSDGNIVDLDPEEALEHPVLDGQNIYPYDLTRLKVSSTQYRGGILNKFLWHEEQINIPDIPGDNNDQPFTVVTEDGIRYVVAAEPWGDSSGILEIWMADARTGEMVVRQWDPQDTQVGPERAMNYVRQEHPLWDWNELRPAEPIPTFIDGQLHWNVRVITSAPLVRGASFVNANTGEVTTFRQDSDVRTFVREGQGEGIVNQTPNETDDGFITIQILDADGNVVRTIEVAEGQTIRVGDADTEED